MSIWEKKSNSAFGSQNIVGMKKKQKVKENEK